MVERQSQARASAREVILGDRFESRSRSYFQSGLGAEQLLPEYDLRNLHFAFAKLRKKIAFDLRTPLNH